MPVNRLASIAACSAAAVALVGAQQPARYRPAPRRPSSRSRRPSSWTWSSATARPARHRPHGRRLRACGRTARRRRSARSRGLARRRHRHPGRAQGAGGVTTIGTPPPPEDGTPETAERSPSVTALVFDALSAEAVGLCQRAALEALPMTQMPNAQVAVFSTYPGVTPLQLYTDDPTLVRSAVRKVMATGQSHRPDGEALQALRERREALDQQASTAMALQSTAGGGGLSGTSQNIGQLEMERHLAIGQLHACCRLRRPRARAARQSTTVALFTILQSMVELRGARRWCCSRRACRPRRRWRPTCRRSSRPPTAPTSRSMRSTRAACAR